MTNYIGIAAFAFIYLYWKIVHKTKLIPLLEVDLVSGKKEIDDDEEYWLRKAEARGPLNFWQRIYDRMV